MLDNTEFEWVAADATPVLLYPGSTSDDALVEPGEITAVVFGGSDGVAPYGDRDKVLDLLLRLADAVRNAPPVPATEVCIAATIDPTAWQPGPLAPGTDQQGLDPVQHRVPPAHRGRPALGHLFRLHHAFNKHKPQTPLRLVPFLPQPTTKAHSANDSQPTRRRKPLPAIGTTYALCNPLWPCQILSARRGRQRDTRSRLRPRPSQSTSTPVPTLVGTGPAWSVAAGLQHPC
ncbi:hypothetical protein ACWCQZ_50690 [Streptomyces sp. NPDC002285]